MYKSCVEDGLRRVTLGDWWQIRLSWPWWLCRIV